MDLVLCLCVTWVSRHYRGGKSGQNFCSFLYGERAAGATTGCRRRRGFCHRGTRVLGSRFTLGWQQDDTISHGESAIHMFPPSGCFVHHLCITHSVTGIFYARQSHRLILRFSTLSQTPSHLPISYSASPFSPRSFPQ